MPHFSIIIPCYNAVKTIDDTLFSLMKQSFPKWEALCIDDGSCDGTGDVIDGYCERDPRFRSVRNPSKGPSNARNYGALIKARGKILSFCDADDIWEPDKLLQLYNRFQAPQITGLYGKIGFFNSKPGDSEARSTVSPNTLSITDLVAENPVCTLSNLSLRRGAFEAVGGFDPEFVHNEDLDLLVRLLAHGACIVGMDQLQVWYRCSPNGLSSDLAAMERTHRAVLHRAKGFGFSGSAHSEAVYLRYLARRALRMNSDRTEALKLTLRGLRQSPSGFLLPLRRGGGTAAASVAALVLPQALRTTLFS